MRISDWSSDVCSSDLLPRARSGQRVGWQFVEGAVQPAVPFGWHPARVVRSLVQHPAPLAVARQIIAVAKGVLAHLPAVAPVVQQRAKSEEHTSELQSLMRISYAVFCLKKKKKIITLTNNKTYTR